MCIRTDPGSPPIAFIRPLHAESPGNMDALNAILQAHAAHGADTTDRLLGAAFAVVNEHGMHAPS